MSEVTIATFEDLMAGEVEVFHYEPLPAGFYNAVITGAEVASGKKGPYIKIEVTIHDEEYRGRKAWKNAVSFSPNAISREGGPRQLAKAVQPDIPRETPANELPAALASACLSAPVKVEIKHEPANEKGPGGNYVPAFNDDGSPKMRDVINAFFPADEDFVARVEKEAAGLDDDLPF